MGGKKRMPNGAQWINAFLKTYKQNDYKLEKTLSANVGLIVCLWPRWWEEEEEETFSQSLTGCSTVALGWVEVRFVCTI